MRNADTETVTQAIVPTLGNPLRYSLMLSSDRGICIVNGETLEDCQFVIEDQNVDISKPLAIRSKSGLELYCDTTPDAKIMIQSENTIV